MRGERLRLWAHAYARIVGAALALPECYQDENQGYDRQTQITEL
jgi:hypothetical protein